MNIVLRWTLVNVFHSKMVAAFPISNGLFFHTSFDGVGGGGNYPPPTYFENNLNHL